MSSSAPAEENVTQEEETKQLTLPPVDEALLAKVMELGFEPVRARKALMNGANNVEAALQWCIDHENDDDIDQPIELVPKETPPVAKSIKCVATGKLFRSMEEAQRYAEKTGRTEFEECTDEKPALTEDEKRAKVHELKALAAARRAEREGIDKVQDIDREKRRREAGKTMGQTREELAKAQRVREVERMKREKEAEKKERERLRAEIAKDKAERRARGGRLAGKLSVEGYLPDVDHDDDRRPTEEEKSTAPSSLSPEEMVDKAIASLSRYRTGGDGGVALKTLATYLSNAKDRDDPKFRTIPATSKAFRDRIAPLVGGVALLKAVGFTKTDDGFTLPAEAAGKDSPNASLIQATIAKLKSAHMAYLEGTASVK